MAASHPYSTNNICEVYGWQVQLQHVYKLGVEVTCTNWTISVVFGYVWIGCSSKCQATLELYMVRICWYSFVIMVICSWHECNTVFTWNISGEYCVESCNIFSNPVSGLAQQGVRIGCLIKLCAVTHWSYYFRSHLFFSITEFLYLYLICSLQQSFGGCHCCLGRSCF